MKAETQALDTRRLRRLAARFARMLGDSPDIQRAQTDLLRRRERALRLLMPDRIPTLTEPEIRELFFDTSAFAFWQNKDAEMNRRVGKVGLDGIRSTLQFLIDKAEGGLGPEDLMEIQSNTGLGLLLSTELATYRYPDRCWIFSARATPEALDALGYSLRSMAPRGRKSEAFLYIELREPMARIRAALVRAGLPNVDNLMADLFLWWVRKMARPRIRLRAGDTGTAATQKIREGGISYAPLSITSFLRDSLRFQGLHFTGQQIASFYTALQVKGFVILSGISGTGKTRLAQHFAAILDVELPGRKPKLARVSAHQPEIRNRLFVPVRTDWRDSKSLLGYYNPLTGQYEWTEFLRFLLAAAESYSRSDGRAWFVILDEMNLARVEYYFADMLSVLESGRDEAGWTREPLRISYPEEAHGPPRQIFLPPSLYLVGTVNVDETTHPFSPKALDRAFALELTEVDFSQRAAAAGGAPPSLEQRQHLLHDFTLEGRFIRTDYRHLEEPHPVATQRLQVLNDLLRPHSLHFGYRVYDEILTFMHHARQNRTFEGNGGEDAAFDAAVLMKVLPKFHGSRARLDRPIRALLAWCLNPDAPDEDSIRRAIRAIEAAAAGDLAVVLERELGALGYVCPSTAARARRLLDGLYTEGFASLG